MTKAPKNWINKGYLLPTVIDPDENICICVPVPKDWGHINAFLGQMTELSKWLTWEKDGTDSAARAARRWFDITQEIISEVNCIMATGSGCGCHDDEITNQRYTSDGDLEISTDGGLTYESGDDIDPRFTSPVFSPLSGADGSVKRCKAANSIVTTLKDEKDKASDILGAAGGVAGLLIAAAGFVASTGVGLVAGAIIALIGAVLTAIVEGGQVVFDDSFDDEFWDNVLCILFCNQQDDASFSKDNWHDIMTEVAALLPYPANDWTRGMIMSAGPVGLTNIGRLGRAGSLSCDGCDCDVTCPDKYDVRAPYTSPEYGTVINRGADYVDVEIGTTGYAAILAENYGSCCTVAAITVISGSPVAAAHIPCGTPYSEGAYIFSSGLTACCSVLLMTGTPGDVIRYSFVDC